MKVALTFNVKKKDETLPLDYYSEFDSPETIEAISRALCAKGHTVDKIDVDDFAALSYFKKKRVDTVFNIAEGRSSRFRESAIPALLDSLDISYTGSGTFSLVLAMNKALTKKILLAEGIPTPAFQVFKNSTEELNKSLRFPLIVKPNYEGSAKGINKTSVVINKEALYNKVKETISLYKQEALVEEFIEGKELTVGILENGKTIILPVLEIDFLSCLKSGEYFYSWRMKEHQGNIDLGLTPTFYCPGRLDKETERQVKETALRTHHAVGCFGVSRTDIRLSRDNIPYVLEINPLPGLNPCESNLPFMAYAAGMKYEDLIEAILLSALEKKRLN
ncbi:MAG: ATP-grasp domain-containing protein [Candidatus Omnitrophota bacterium]|nr:ATP-grasp domain-containing protein [Candidatus Omnitrophota bacterium]